MGRTRAATEPPIQEPRTHLAARPSQPIGDPVPTAAGELRAFPQPTGPDWHEATIMTLPIQPAKQGLYDPQFEHDACGVGFVVDLKNRKSHDIVQKAVQILLNLEHRGACGCEKNTGDGAGILFQTPHPFLSEECAKQNIKLPDYDHYGLGIVF